MPTTGGQDPTFAAINAFCEALDHKVDVEVIRAKLKPCEGALDTEPVLEIYLELLRQVVGTMKIN